MTQILILVPASLVLGLQVCTTRVYVVLGLQVCTTRIYVVPGLEPKAKHMLGKCPNTWASSSHPQPVTELL